MRKIFTILLVLCAIQSVNAQGALNFPDANDYGKVPFDPLFELTDNFTIESWVKVSGSGYQTVAATDSLNGSGHFGYWFGVTPSGVAGFQIFNGTFSWNTFTGTTNINDGNWHHISVTNDGTSVKIFTDGVLESTGAYYAPVYSSHALDVGVDQEGNYLSGALDDLRIWWRALPDDSVTVWKDSCITTLPWEDSLLLHYKFDETMGSTFADAGLYNVDGTLYNMTDNDWIDGIVCQPATSPTGGLYFDAVNDYVELDTVQDAALDFSGDFTIEAWVKPETGGVWPSIVSNFDNVSGSRYGFWFGITGSGTLGMQVFNGTSASWNTAYGTTQLEDNTWRHVAGVLDGDTMRVYVNGVLEGSAPTGFTPVFNEHAVWFGNDAENDIFKGTMDRVRLWNVKRTEAEILADKDVCLNGQEAGLLGLYHFSEGSGSTTANMASSQYLGTLKNMDDVTSWVGGTTCDSTSTASIGSIESALEVKVYPNPTEGKVQVDLKEATDVSIQVYSMTGQLIHTVENIQGKTYEFNLEGKPGVYHMVIYSNGSTKREKLIKL